MGNRILVLGSTGNVGRPLVESLREAGEAVVAASRNPQGVGQVKLDLTDPTTFEPALEGVDRVFVVAPPGYAATHELLAPFLETAFRARRKFVLQSADGVQFNDQAPLRQVELRLERSGHPFVFLRPNWFMDNFHTFWLAPIQKAGVIPLPAGDSRSALIDVLDIAAAASAALRSSEFDGQAFSLSGPEALTYAEAAAVLSRHAGREIRYQPVDDASFVASLVEAGVPADYSQFLAVLFSFVRQGAASSVTGAVKALTGREPGTLDAYAQRHAKKFAN
jgi:uncharacterized protein YbjT (DUF2867 family)